MPPHMIPSHDSIQTHVRDESTYDVIPIETSITYNDGRLLSHVPQYRTNNS
jgi:hypothetical protein